MLLLAHGRWSSVGEVLAKTLPKTDIDTEGMTF